MPLGQGGGSALFENVAVGEMTFVVEVVVDQGLDDGKLLRIIHLTRLILAYPVNAHDRYM